MEPASVVMAHIRDTMSWKWGLIDGFEKIIGTNGTEAARFVVMVRRTHMVSVVKLPVHGFHTLGLEEF